jgi:hypothetical protein
VWQLHDDFDRTDARTLLSKPFNLGLATIIARRPGYNSHCQHAAMHKEGDCQATNHLSGIALPAY